jgi:hypothetical protein
MLECGNNFSSARTIPTLHVTMPGSTRGDRGTIQKTVYSPEVRYV